MGIKLTTRLALSSITMAIIALPTSADALVINNYFSYNLKNNARAAEIIAAINYSSNAFASLLSNDVTVNIQYDIDTFGNNYLGKSGASNGFASKLDYVEMMTANAAAHPENTVLATALKNLGQGNYGNPEITEMMGTSAELRANGIPAVGYFEQALDDDGETPYYNLGGDTLKEGGLDGVVVLGRFSDMLFGFDIPVYDGTRESVRFSAINTLQHEIMHILGGGNSKIDWDDDSGPDTMMVPLDMYRYSAPGKPDFGQTPEAYFSIDGGVTKIQDFNDGGGTDTNAWGPTRYICEGGRGRGGPIGLFMDAFSCPSQPTVTFNLDSPEGKALMALGWNPRVAAVPEPATWTMMLIGFGGIGAALRRRRTARRLCSN